MSAPGCVTWLPGVRHMSAKVRVDLVNIDRSAVNQAHRPVAPLLVSGPHELARPMPHQRHVAADGAIYSPRSGLGFRAMR